jgi:hypothetical protein
LNEKVFVLGMQSDWTCSSGESSRLFYDLFWDSLVETMLLFISGLIFGETAQLVIVFDWYDVTSFLFGFY